MAAAIRWAFALACLLPALPALALEVVQVDLRANDLVYNPHDGLLYASVPASAPTRANTVTRIDPTTGALLGSLPVGSDPRKLALSDDGSRLYVALHGAASVVAIELPAWTAGTPFTLGFDAVTGPNYAEDIAVQPGHPEVIAVSLMNSGYSPRHEGVAIFDDGVARPERTPDHTGSNRIEFSSDPERLYGYNNESTEYGFRRMYIVWSGVWIEDVTRNLISGFSREIVYDHGRIYSSGGQVIDPEARTLLGTFPLPGSTFDASVAPDSNRAYFLTGESAGMELSEYDALDFTLLLRQPVPGVAGRAQSVVRWGEAGLAFRSTNLYGESQKVVILDAIHDPPTSDLTVVQSDQPDPVSPDAPLTYRLTVRNLGPSGVSGVWLRDRYPGTYRYTTTTRGSCYDSSGTIVCTLGGLSTGDSATVHVNLLSPEVGVIENVAWVQGAFDDPVPGNNLSTEQTLVRRPPVADLWMRVLSMPRVATVDAPVSIGLRIGNLGPDAAETARVGAALYSPPSSGRVEAIHSARGNCQWDGSPLTQCAMGDVAAADSFDVTVVVRPLAVGPLILTFSTSSDVSDPVYANNSSGFLNFPVLESAEHLIEELLSLVHGIGLKHGPQVTLAGKLVDALRGLAAEDTSATCDGLAAFRDEVMRRAGRALSVPEAYALLEGMTMVIELLDCGSRSRHDRQTVRPAHASEAGTGTDSTRPGTSLPVSLDLQWAEGNPAGRVLLMALPAGGRARIEVHDVQGRRLGTLVDQTFEAGRHRIAWGDGRVGRGTLAAGVYFLRLSLGDRSTVMKAVWIE